MPNAAKINFKKWDELYIREQEIERLALEKMTEEERIGYLAAKASLTP